MWPLILAAGGLAAYLFGSKPKGKNAAAVLAETTTKLGQPVGTQNWPAPSGRIYRMSWWNSPAGKVALIVGGAAAAQQSTPDAYWLIQASGSSWQKLATVEPDATAKADFETMQTSFVA